jgi:hypothetical protein
MGYHFFDAREAHAAHLLSFSHICFCVPYGTEEKAPEDFIPFNEFYRKRGYIHHPELRCHVLRRQLGHKTPIEGINTFWIKEIQRTRS